jgi:hypothetical protein
MIERSRGRPSNEEKISREKEKLNCSQNTFDEIVDLRKELKFASGSKLLLLLSIASDDMIRLVMMYPEVFFMDVTGCVNRQKRDFFLMAVKDALGRIFTGNLTTIPSGRSWVFLIIFRWVFPFLYGVCTIQRNRLALTDEDIAEYKTFESCIVGDANYKNTKLGLCSFHALWKPYKETVKPLLPKNGQAITEVGKDYGMFLYNRYIECETNKFASYV